MLNFHFGLFRSFRGSAAHSIAVSVSWFCYFCASRNTQCIRTTTEINWSGKRLIQNPLLNWVLFVFKSCSFREMTHLASVSVFWYLKAKSNLKLWTDERDWGSIFRKIVKAIDDFLINQGHRLWRKLSIERLRRFNNCKSITILRDFPIFNIFSQIV